jgi:hypothetical protein
MAIVTCDKHLAHKVLLPPTAHNPVTYDANLRNQHKATCLTNLLPDVVDFRKADAVAEDSTPNTNKETNR